MFKYFYVIKCLLVGLTQQLFKIKLVFKVGPMHLKSSVSLAGPFLFSEAVDSCCAGGSGELHHLLEVEG